MRKSIMLVLISVSLISCFSYKELRIDHVEFDTMETYKITAAGKKVKKGKFQTLSDSLIFLRGRRGQQHEISRDEILEIKKRKFSLGKTMAGPIVVTGVVIGATIVGLSNWSFDIGW